MAEIALGFDTKDDWLRAILLDELWAFHDFNTLPFVADGACGLGWFVDDLPASFTVPADARNGRGTMVVPASQTFTLAAGPAGSAYGVTSGRRNPSVLFRLTPVAASANLSVQRWGFVAPAATDPLGGVYVRSTTTGNLFFVARNETTGVETTYDMGVAPAVDTDYRIYTNDNGVTFCLEINGVTQPVAMTTNVPASTTRLLPKLTVTAGGGGTASITIDLANFRAWRSTPPISQPDRITLADIEQRLRNECLLLWWQTSGNGILPTQNGLYDFAAIKTTNSDVIAGYFTGIATLNAMAAVSPNQSPFLMGRWSFVDDAAATRRQPFGFMASLSGSASGAYLCVLGSGVGNNGTLQFVTRQGAAETVTSITTGVGAGTVPLVGRYEVRTLDGGASWQALRDGAVVASHSTNCPTIDTALIPGYSNQAGGSPAFDTIFAGAIRRR